MRKQRAKREGGIIGPGPERAGGPEAARVGGPEGGVDGRVEFWLRSGGAGEGRDKGGQRTMQVVCERCEVRGVQDSGESTGGTDGISKLRAAGAGADGRSSKRRTRNIRGRAV